MHSLHIPTHLNLMKPMPYVSSIQMPKYRRMFTRGDLKMREGRQSAKVT